ncbi:unnamed protein product [Dibothriocephalus latus]|uniref:Peptidase A2 domain-containing protein n=1 Tax=Dibothriocephalus latus TaxID=60516 RepID=A0A3P7LGD5_DIBLA|nr:unnamed protein product [Dibothriocephalus latus]
MILRSWSNPVLRLPPPIFVLSLGRSRSCHRSLKIPHPETHYQRAGSVVTGILLASVPSRSMFVTNAINEGSNSLLATFKTDFEARRKYFTVTINGKPVRLQLDTASDTSLISKHTWRMIGQPPMITSDKKALNVSGGFFRLTSELECDVSFDGTEFKGTCYLTNRPKLDLIGLD